MIKKFFRSFGFEEGTLIYPCYSSRDLIIEKFSEILKYAKAYIRELEKHPEKKNDFVCVIPGSVNPYRHAYDSIFYKEKDLVITGMKYGRKETAWRIVVIPLTSDEKVILLVPRKDGGFTPFTYILPQEIPFYEPYYKSGEPAPDFPDVESEVVFVIFSTLVNLNIYPEEEWARYEFLDFPEGISTISFIQKIDSYIFTMENLLKKQVVTSKRG